MISLNGQTFGLGWRPDLAAEAVPKMVAERNLQGFAFFLAPLAEPPPKASLMPYMEKVFGPKWWLNQGSCGSCVAHTGALACDVLTAISIVKSGGQGPSKRADPMSIYWGSRVEIGKGQVKGEGSVNVWMAEWLRKYGAIPQDKYPSLDLSRYDPSVCCGPLSRRGVPDDMEPIAKKFPVKDYEQVKSFDELKYAISNGYPVPVASSQGFRMELDRNGFGTPSGTWNHSQLIVGYEDESDPCAYVANHWGDCYTGGPKDWPRGVMKVRSTTIDRMLKEGDSFALSNFVGFPRQTLDFSPLNF